MAGTGTLPSARGTTLVAAAVGLMCVAWLALLVVAVATSGGSGPAQTVAADGRPHAVTVPAGRGVMAWTQGADVDCTVVDAASGQALGSREVGGDHRLDDQVADWTAVARWAPASSDRVEATCAGGGVVGLGAAPRGPAFLAGLSPWFAVPAVLAVVSLALGGVGLRRRVSAGRPAGSAG